MNSFYLVLASHASSPAEGESSEAAMEAPTWLNFLHNLPFWPDWLPVSFAWSVVVLLLLVALCFFGTRKMARVPRGLQNLLEMYIENIENFIVGIMGEAGRRFVPFLGTLFIYIAIMNLFGLIPGFGSATANINTTMGMAVVVFFVVQYHGIRQNGISYFKHFLGEPIWLFPIMLPLHIIAEIVRPLTLGLRLYGNIHGEEVAIFSFVLLAAGLPVYLQWVPLQFPMMLLACLTSLIQAVVFVLLSSLYLTLASPEEEH